ncbi:MAG: glycosyltransferase family 2 protein [Rikenellaceae bacterium]|nr:glycosyltransferase family 2 protein [Rikenellaceae bacterium]
MVTAGWILFDFGLLRLAVALYNAVSRPYLPQADGTAYLPSVSVLIPARDEQENLDILLGGFTRWRDEVFELIVYDDLSSDKTFAVAAEYAAADSKIRIIKGGGLPPGWLGKNHACDCLAADASGNILLFIDADVRLEKGSVTRAVSYMVKENLALLSIFPRQILDNAGSVLCVPLMNWILLSLLPLAAVRFCSRPSLAAANGQFMMFCKERYDILRPHSRFRKSAVEDIAIIKYYKRQRLRVATLLGRDDAGCRMYSGLKDAVEGFSKNIFDFFGGSATLCFVFVAATTAAPFWIFFQNGIAAGILYLGIIIAIRVAVSIASRQKILLNVLAMIPQQMVLWAISAKALINRKRKRQVWKGRNIN